MALTIVDGLALRRDGSNTPTTAITFPTGDLAFAPGDLQFCVINAIVPSAITPTTADIDMPPFTGSTFFNTAEQYWTIPSAFGSGPRRFFASFWYRQVMDDPADSVVTFDIPPAWITGPPSHLYRWNVNLLTYRADWGDIPGPTLQSALKWTSDNTDSDAEAGFVAPSMLFGERDVSYLYVYLRATTDSISLTGQVLNGYSAPAQIEGSGGGPGIGAEYSQRLFTEYLGYDWPTFGINNTGQMVQGWCIRDSLLPGRTGGGIYVDDVLHI